MNYHFKLHKEKDGYWAECLELPGCNTQGSNIQEVKFNAQKVLNLYLEESDNSKIIFPLPSSRYKTSKTICPIRVDSTVAFAFLMRRARLEFGFSQQQMKKLLNLKSLASYQKLEKAKYANPTLKTLDDINELLPEFPFQLLF